MVRNGGGATVSLASAADKGRPILAQPDDELGYLLRATDTSHRMKRVHHLRCLISWRARYFVGRRHSTVTDRVYPDTTVWSGLMRNKIGNWRTLTEVLKC